MVWTIEKAREGRMTEENAIQNDVDNFIEGEMDGAFNDLVEQVSDPRRLSRRSRRSRYQRRRRRFGPGRRRRRRRYCIRLPGACGK